LLFPEAVKTHLYIDGFNLYYGCLKDSRCKWLDPAQLAAHLLPGHAITAIHYFSANVTARPGDPDQPIRQQTISGRCGLCPTSRSSWASSRRTP
jgi:hypothetical protein